MALTHAQLEALWTKAGGPALDADTAAAIAQAESGGNANAIDNTAYPSKPGYHAPAPGAQPEFSVGLWQINLLAHPQYTEAGMLEPAENARAAVAISDRGTNFTPWSTYTSGAYRRFLAHDAGARAGSSGSSAPSALSGWHAYSTAIARTLPAALARSHHYRTVALRHVSRASRLR